MDDDVTPDQALKSLTQNNIGVKGYVVMDKSGIPVKHHGMEQKDALQYSALVSSLRDHTAQFLDTNFQKAADNFWKSGSKKKGKLYTLERDGQYGMNIHPNWTRDEDDELQVIRLRTRKNEIVICPEKEFTLVVVHDPNQGNEPEEEKEEKTDEL